MNDRHKSTIIGYVGTTLNLIDKPNVWFAAKELSIINFDSLDFFIEELDQDTLDELEPLIDVLKHPNKLIADVDPAEIRKLIYERIGISANDLIANPPLAFSTNDIATISTNTQSYQNSLRISPTNGRNRSYNIETLQQTYNRQIAWLYSVEGQSYLFGSNISLESEETRLGLLEGITQATGFRLIENILAPYSSELYSGIQHWLPQNSSIQNAAWWTIKLGSFFSNFLDIAMDVAAAGPLAATFALLGRGLHSLECENEQNHSPTSYSNSSYGSFWHNLAARLPQSSTLLEPELNYDNAHRLI